MFDDLFGKAESDRFEAANHINDVLMIEPLEDLGEIKTVNGMKPAVDARITVLSGEQKGVVFDDARLFGGALVGAARRNLRAGKIIVARLVQGVAKPGQKAPWLLKDKDADSSVGAYLPEAAALYTEAKAAREKADAPF